MKKLKEYITEKMVYTSKNRNIYRITPEQFKVLCIYILVFLEDDELRDEQCILWGELERSGEFGLDFGDEENSWIDKYWCGYSDDDTEMLNKMDKFADPIHEIAKIILDIYNEDQLINSAKMLFRTIIFYIMEYFTNSKYSSKAFNLNKVDLTLINDEINYPFKSNKKLTFNINKNLPWSTLVTNKDSKKYSEIRELINKAGEAAIDLL
jgi:hypothetical protein